MSCAPSAPFCSLQGAFMGWTPATGSQDSTCGLWCSEPGEGRAGTSSHGRLPGGGRSCWKWTSREVDTRTMVMVVACFHYSGNLVSSELWRIFLTLNSPPKQGGSQTGSVFLVPGTHPGSCRLKVPNLGCTLESPGKILYIQMPRTHPRPIKSEHWGGAHPAVLKAINGNPELD